MEKFHDIEKNAKTLKMYLIFWIGQMLSMFGSSIVQFAAMWWITVETEDPIYMTVLMLAFMIPRIVLGAFGGVWADKYNKKVIIFLVDAFQALITLFMILFSSLWIESVWVFILFISIRHIGQGIQQPAVNTITPMLVPDEYLSQMNGLASLFNTLLQLASPFIGAYITTIWSLSQIMWIDVISFIAASIPLLFISLPALIPIMENVKSEEKQKSSFKEDFKEGFQTISATPGLWVLITTAIFNNLFITPFSILATFYIYMEHQGSAGEYALVGLFVQLGIIGGSLLMSIKKNWKRKRLHFTLWHYIAFGGFILMGLAPFRAFWMIALGGFIFLFGIPVINTFYLTYIQISVPKDKLGRVFALDATFSSIATPIGMILCSPMANAFGIGNVFVICGVLALTIISVFILTGQIRKIDFDAAERAQAEAEIKEEFTEAIPTAAVESI